MRILLLSAALATTASAQITQYEGPSPNITSSLDFDAPAVPAGPIASTSSVFTAAGITSLDLIGTGYTVVGDALTLASNADGNGLAAQNGVLTVVAVGDPIDDISNMGGFEVQLASPADEFQVTFIDQINFWYGIELFSGSTSLGYDIYEYSGAFPRDPHYWRGPAPFDRVQITFPNTFTIGVGIDTIGFGNGPAAPTPIPDHCVETGIYGGNGGNPGGAVYLDLTAASAVTIDGLQTHFDAGAGTSVGIEVYTCSGSAFGQEDLPGAWTLAAVDDGLAISAGPEAATDITFVSPLSIPAGTTGIALVAIDSGHDYTNGPNGFLTKTSADGTLTVEAGTASNTPFATPIFTPRVWNGRFCWSGGAAPGVPYCDPNVVHSGGVSAMLSASGSSSVAANDLVLEATNLPPFVFGFFLVSSTQANSPMAGGSQGTLCLGGAIGRFFGPGQIMNSGAGAAYSLAVDNTAIPQGIGSVAVMTGDVWNFQSWFRDTVGGQATSNFTNGLEVTFTP